MDVKEEAITLTLAAPRGRVNSEFYRAGGAVGNPIGLSGPPPACRLPVRLSRRTTTGFRRPTRLSGPANGQSGFELRHYRRRQVDLRAARGRRWLSRPRSHRYSFSLMCLATQRPRTKNTSLRRLT